MIGAVAIAIALGCVMVSDDASAMSYDLTGADFAEVGTNETFILSYNSMPKEAKYVAMLIDSKGNEMPSAIGSGSSGSLTEGDSGYTKAISVTAPKTAGDYRLVVLILVEGDEVAKITSPFKVVDAVVLSVTLENKDSAERHLIIYFWINGEKIEDSKQDVTVPANGTKEVTFDYVVKDLGHKTEFYVQSDDSTLGGKIEGLGPEHTHTFYTSQNSYTAIEVIAVVVLLIVAALAIWIYRKPIKNYGKPKGRR